MQAKQFNRKEKNWKDNTWPHDKYIATQEFSKLITDNFAARWKEAKSATTTDLNTAEQHVIKNEEKLRKLKTFDASFFTWQFF